MPETSHTAIEKLDSKAKELGSESLEKIQTEWKGFLELVDKALESPEAATKEAARKIVQKIIALIRKYNAPAAQELEDDLMALLYEADQVDKFVNKLSTYSTEDLKRFLRENIQLPELPEEQKYRIETMKVLYTVLQAYESKAAEGNDPGASALVQNLLSQTTLCTKECLQASTINFNKLSHDLLAGVSELNKKIPAPGLSTILLSSVHSSTDLNKVRATAISTLRGIGGYKEAQILAIDAFPKESAAAEKLAAINLSTHWNEAYHHAQLELYGEFNSLTKQGETPEKARAMLDATAKALADQAMDFWRPKLLFEKMETKSLSPDQKLVWNQINDMGDYKNEWFNMSDGDVAFSKEAVTQVVTLVATFIVPEIVALRAIALSGDALLLLRSGRMATYAEELLGARYATLIGKIGLNSGKLVAGQVAGELTFKGVRIATNQETLDTAFKDNHWLEDMFLGASLETPLDMAILMSGGELTLAKEILIGISSDGLARFGKDLVGTGQKELCSYFFAGALKNGEYKGDPKKILAFCGEEIYKMCGSPSV